MKGWMTRGPLFTFGLAAGLGLFAHGAVSVQAQQTPRATSAGPAPTRARGATQTPPAVTADPAATPATPALNAAGLYAIQNAKIVTLAGPAIDRGTIVIERGKIVDPKMVVAREQR